MGKVSARLSLSGAARIQGPYGSKLGGVAPRETVPGTCRADPRFCPAA